MGASAMTGIKEAYRIARESFEKAEAARRAEYDAEAARYERGVIDTAQEIYASLNLLDGGVFDDAMRDESGFKDRCVLAIAKALR